jgi:hypothetical protein
MSQRRCLEEEHSNSYPTKLKMAKINMKVLLTCGIIVRELTTNPKENNV